MDKLVCLLTAFFIQPILSYRKAAYNKSMQANVRRETARRIDPKGVYG
jgi:hypothetical protein